LQQGFQRGAAATKMVENMFRLPLLNFHNVDFLHRYFFHNYSKQPVKKQLRRQSQPRW
jgi:hypothetical protein